MIILLRILLVLEGGPSRTFEDPTAYWPMTYRYLATHHRKLTGATYRPYKVVLHGRKHKLVGNIDQACETVFMSQVCYFLIQFDKMEGI
jgi:hypothetical protein